jgi:hypothetical protein
MTGLRRLRLECDPLTYADLASLSVLTRLEELDLTACVLESPDLEPLRKLTSLTCLELADIEIVTELHQGFVDEYVLSLEPLRDLTSLTDLTLMPYIVRQQSDMTVLGALTALRMLRLDGQWGEGGGMQSDAVWFLARLTGLVALGLGDSDGLDDTALPYLRPLTSLTALDLHFCPHLTCSAILDTVQRLSLLTRLTFTCTKTEEVQREAICAIIHQRGGRAVYEECRDRHATSLPHGGSVDEPNIGRGYGGEWRRWPARKDGAEDA